MINGLIIIILIEPSRFDHPMANVSSRRNDAVTLSCLAKGDEPINIIWTHNNGRIDLNNYRYVCMCLCAFSLHAFKLA